MHEVGIMQSVLDMAMEAARREGAEHIHVIKMRVGALSAVVPEALEFAFTALSQETPAEGGKLEVEYLPATCWCAGCDAPFQPKDIVFECPKCGELSFDVRGGKELDIVSVEVS